MNFDSKSIEIWIFSTSNNSRMKITLSMKLNKVRTIQRKHSPIATRRESQDFIIWNLLIPLSRFLNRQNIIAERS